MYTGIPLLSGIITEKTHFIFRSRSTRIVWLVQISKEMYEYDSINNEIYFNKFITKFVNIVFNYWKALNVTHSLTVVYFARSIIYTTDTNTNNNAADNTNNNDIYNAKNTTANSYNNYNTSNNKSSNINGGHNSDPSDQPGITYKDYFKVVLENITTDMIDYNIHIKILKKEFWSFPQNVGWNLFNTTNNHTAANNTNNSSNNNIRHHPQPYSDPIHTHIQQIPHNSDPFLQSNSISKPSDAASGNFLEALNSPHNSDPFLQNSSSISKPSDAASGNFLEALNSSLNLLDKHYLDRDLLRTGNSIVVISAGIYMSMCVCMVCALYVCMCVY